MTKLVSNNKIEKIMTNFNSIMISSFGKTEVVKEEILWCKKINK